MKLVKPCIKEILGPAIEKLMSTLQTEMNAIGIEGSYTPRRGDLCAARYSADNVWHRVRVEGLKAGRVDVYYIDFGNVSFTFPAKATFP